MVCATDDVTIQPTPTHHPIFLEGHMQAKRLVIAGLALLVAINAGRRTRRSISPGSGRRGSTRTSRSACRGRSSSTTRAFRSVTRSRARVRVGGLDSDAPGVAVPATLGRLHLARTVAAAPVEGSRPDSREITAFHAEWLRSVDNTVYLDDRPRPPDEALPPGAASPKPDGTATS
jgi:hypothetical protein